MSFSSLFSSTHEHKKSGTPGEIWALLDIQSGLVRGSLVLLSPGNPSRIMYTIQHSIPHKSEINAAYITKTMLHGVKEVATKLAHEGMHRARNAGVTAPLSGVHYILSSPWVISETKTIHVSYPKPTTITRAVVQNIIDSAREEIEAHAGAKHLDAVSIEQKIFEVKLNGYSVTEYEGKTTEKLEVSCALSVSSGKTLERISHAVNRVLHTKVEHHHSALLLEYVGLRSILHKYNEYMVIHAHSELTDVVVVRGGMCVFISSFPFGIFTAIRKIAHAAHQGFTSADSLLTLFDEKKLSDAERTRISPVFEAVGKGWAHDLFGTLAHAGDTMVIPRKVILSAHSHFSFFAKQLDGNPIAPDFRPDISALELDMVKDFVVYDNGQDRSLRIGIYTTAIASL